MVAPLSAGMILSRTLAYVREHLRAVANQLEFPADQLGWLSMLKHLSGLGARGWMRALRSVVRNQHLRMY